MTDEEPPAEVERGLPGKQGEFTISFVWPARLLLTAAIGAIVGFGASTVLGTYRLPSAGWVMIPAGAGAATLLSIRRVHGWHVSTFADGTIAGLAAPPLYVLLTFILAAFQPKAHLTLGGIGEGLLAILFSFMGMPISVPCGWIAGFGYHIALSTVERMRADGGDQA